MEIVTTAEAWDGEGEDMVYHHTFIVVRQDSHHFFARQYDRWKEIKVEDLTLEPIPDTWFYAPFPDDLTQAPDPLPGNVYVKRPSLIGYEPSITNGCDTLLEEAKIYETLLLNPHKNIAQYHGCLVEDGMFHALCIEKYPTTLSALIDKDADLSEEEKKRIMQDIRAGVAHLHSVGFVHNDLNPTNIMLTDDGTAVVIDFDSARPTGEPLGLKGATPFWEVDSKFSLPENDLQQVDQIERTLFKDPADEASTPPPVDDEQIPGKDELGTSEVVLAVA
ncbi:kinase-like domain-containing protein [Nemania abortiva]|nr:kinase-like domain-containing protein [Nemania abortiva]